MAGSVQEVRQLGLEGFSPKKEVNKNAFHFSKNTVVWAGGEWVLQDAVSAVKLGFDNNIKMTRWLALNSFNGYFNGVDKSFQSGTQFHAYRRNAKKGF